MPLMKILIDDAFVIEKSKCYASKEAEESHKMNVNSEHLILLGNLASKI